MLTVVYALVSILPPRALALLQSVARDTGNGTNYGATGHASGWIWFWIAVVVLFVILFAWPGIGRRRRVGDQP